MTTAAARARPGNVPGLADVTKVDRWTLPVDDGAAELVVRARLLGWSTSERHDHEDGSRAAVGRPGRRVGAVHDADAAGRRFARPGERCGACRWFEARVFRVEDPGSEHDGEFMIHYTGASIVPGEVDRNRVAFADGGHALVELAVSRNLGQGRVFITPPMARALAMAANHDPDVEHAWVNRAVE